MAEPQQPPRVAAARLIQVLAGIAMLSGFLVALAYQVTRPVIDENQRLATERAVLQVVPGASAFREFRLGETGLLAGDAATDSIPVYAGYRPDGSLAGVALKGSAMGYADRIHLLYGYDPACRCVRGFKVLKMVETPGLGDKIIRDAGFLANFTALDARLNEDGTALANPIVTVKHGRKQHDWEIDAISGATISSVAVGKAINASADRDLPRLLPDLDQLDAADARGADR